MTQDDLHKHAASSDRPATLLQAIDQHNLSREFLFRFSGSSLGLRMSMPIGWSG